MRKSYLKCFLYKKEEGITLLELIIAACLLVMVLSLGYSIYLFGIKGFISNTHNIESRSNVRIAMDHISRTIRQANNVTITESSLQTGANSYRLAGNIIQVNRNQLAVGISAFSFSKPFPFLVHIKIDGTPDKHGDIFSLEAWFFIRSF